MRTLPSLHWCAGLALLACTTTARSQQGRPVIANDLAAFEKLGATCHTLANFTEKAFYYSIGIPPLERSVPAISFVREPQGNLPDLTTPFSLYFAHGALTEAQLPQLAGLKNLVALDVDGYAINDATLKQVAGIKKLRALVLHNSLLTGVGLKELSSLPDFSILSLHTPQITDAGLKELAALRKLTVLGLSSPKITAAGLRELAHVKSLQTLTIDHLLTDANLRVLREVGLLHRLRQAVGKGDARPGSPDEVESMTLTAAQITDASLKELAPLRNLTFLDLSSTQVTDAGLKEVASFKKLTALVLANTQVTNAGLTRLEPLQHLTSLNLRNTQVTDAGLLYLREALPQCQVIR
jgi:Leucine-rich repeat (LRR) protein